MLSVKFVGENVKTSEYTVAKNAEMDDIDENDKVDTVNLDVDQVYFVIHWPLFSDYFSNLFTSSILVQTFLWKSIIGYNAAQLIENYKKRLHFLYIRFN